MRPCQIKRKILLFAFFAVCAVSLSVSKSTATDFTSTNFIVRDPVISSGGTRSTSTSFEFWDSLSQSAVGESTSTAFKVLSGFLYFHFATSPVLSAAAGDGQVSLRWTASSGFHGNITTYEVGTATTSGGPYTFQDVGNVTSFTKTGLTNGTTYFFRVRAFAGSLFAAQSNEASATPAAAAPPPAPAPPAPTGGGGPPIPPICVTEVNFSGRAYPRSTVTLLKDAQLMGTTVAGPTAFFDITASDLSSGTYIFSLYSEDNKGRRSSLVTFPISVILCTKLKINGIFIAPTIDVDKSEVKLGTNIAIFGQSVPKAEILIQVSSEHEFFFKILADSAGAYLYNLDTSVLELGEHFTKSKASIENEVSSFSKAVSFIVGKKTVEKAPPPVCPSTADLNKDCRVNLIDFSIAAFWWKRALSQAFIVLERERLSGDGKLTLVDFSIMAFHWTG